MNPSSAPKAPLARCGGCGEPPAPNLPLRRGRCARCYEAWVRARPVGTGATCAVCDDRRHRHLRHYEIALRSNAPGGRWIILCHNCAGVAETLAPPPRSLEGLKMRLHRDRRWGDRRAESVGRASPRSPSLERRDVDRRESLRDVLDASELVEEVIEMVADYETISEDRLADLDEVTAIHARLPAE